MKKLLLVLPVVALAACSSEQPKTLISGCEKVGSDEFSTTYKCPMSEELAAIQAMEANAMFKSGSEDLAAIAADAENVYVNVATEDKCETEGQVAYRVMVKNPVLDGQAMYAVAICK